VVYLTTVDYTCWDGLGVWREWARQGNAYRILVGNHPRKCPHRRPERNQEFAKMGLKERSCSDGS
jgi:hypothetical protein